MQRIKISKNFCLDEYIPKELYKKYESKPQRLIAMLDSRLIQIDQFLRTRFGSTTINNWYTGGNRNWSGIRTPDSSYYSFTSQHSWGRASDKVYKNVTAEEVRRDIIMNWKNIYQPLGLTTIEANVSWLHSDCRYIKDQKQIFIVYP